MNANSSDRSSQPAVQPASEAGKLRHRVSEIEAARIAYASEFPPIQEGEDAGLPDVGNIHANIRALKAQVSEADMRDARTLAQYELALKKIANLDTYGPTAQKIAIAALQSSGERK